jgi:hypothetical protein
MLGEDLDDPEDLDDDDDCICRFPNHCGGLGFLDCIGCGGDQCICTCGGERECPGCDLCDTSEGFELELDDDPNEQEH